MEKESVKNCGIYVMRDKEGVIRYVGQSRALKKREGDHLRKLANGGHDNGLIQQYYNENYGDFETCITIEIILNCDRKDLSKLEKRLIKEFNTIFINGPGWNRNGGGSTNKDVYKNFEIRGPNGVIASRFNGTKDNKIQTFRVRSPDGVIYEGENIQEFARYFKIGATAIGGVAAGKFFSHLGWTHPDNEGFEIFHKGLGLLKGFERKYFAKKHGIPFRDVHRVLNREQEVVKEYLSLPENADKLFAPVMLFHKDFGVVECLNVAEFHAKYKIKQSFIPRLLDGSAKTRYGWRLASSTDEDVKPVNQTFFTLFHAKHGLVTRRNKAQFCVEFLISVEAQLYRIFDGTLLYYEGWSLPENKDMFTGYIEGYELFHPEHGIVRVLNLRKFCEKYGIKNESGISMLKNGRRKKMHGWTLHTPEMKVELYRGLAWQKKQAAKSLPPVQDLPRVSDLLAA